MSAQKQIISITVHSYSMIYGLCIDTIAKFVLHEFGKEHSMQDSPDSVLSYLEARIEALSNTTNTDSLELIYKMLHESLVSKASETIDGRCICVGDVC
jgi:hypothetical protein